MEENNPEKYMDVYGPLIKQIIIRDESNLCERNIHYVFEKSQTNEEVIFRMKIHYKDEIRPIMSSLKQLNDFIKSGCKLIY